MRKGKKREEEGGMKGKRIEAVKGRREKAREKERS